MLLFMRTTLTLDDDVAAAVQRLRAAGKGKLKVLINEALRLGLQRMESPSPQTKRYRTRPVSLGRCLLNNVDDISETLAVAEGENFR